MIAGEYLRPGDRICLGTTGRAIASIDGPPTGVVDPFLHHDVNVGDRFWMCLYPGTVTTLRHHWTNPKFPVNLPEAK